MLLLLFVQEISEGSRMDLILRRSWMEKNKYADDAGLTFDLHATLMYKFIAIFISVANAFNNRSWRATWLLVGGTTAKRIFKDS